MCKTCGCGITPGNARMHGDQRAGHGAVIDVLQDLLAANDQVALHNREHFDEHGVLAINLMSSPGAGKTSLLEATILALRGRYRIAVIEGDLETDNDAARIRAHGVPAIQITTGTACHLDAHLVHRALHDLPLAGLDLLFIENVGNLVCPASFDLGQHRNVTLLSVTEGDDKPAKYPVIFRASDLVVLSKADLLDVLDDFDPARAAAALRALGRDTPMIRTAARPRGARLLLARGSIGWSRSWRRGARWCARRDHGLAPRSEFDACASRFRCEWRHYSKTNGSRSRSVEFTAAYRSR
jgi:hydrogenase nickel incorporation protein HypB